MRFGQRMKRARDIKAANQQNDIKGGKQAQQQRSRNPVRNKIEISKIRRRQEMQYISQK